MLRFARLPAARAGVGAPGADVRQQSSHAIARWDVARMAAAARPVL